MPGDDQALDERLPLLPDDVPVADRMARVQARRLPAERRAVPSHGDPSRAGGNQPDLPIEGTVLEMRAIGLDGATIRSQILSHVTAKVRTCSARPSIGKACMAYFVDRLDEAIADTEVR